MIRRVLFFQTCLLLLAVVACTRQQASTEGSVSIPILLATELEPRRSEFQDYVSKAQGRLERFAARYAWEGLCREAFMDSVMIFTDKALFNKTLLSLAGYDLNTELPDSYCAALEKRVLMVMSPEYYAAVYPEGQETDAYEKLLTHEMAHRLHIRILDGNEEAMGPIWFYEGFAIYAADQFTSSTIDLSNEEMILVMKDPARGSYGKYQRVFSHFVSGSALPDLVKQAGNNDFNTRLIQTLQ